MNTCKDCKYIHETTIEGFRWMCDNFSMIVADNNEIACTLFEHKCSVKDTAGDD